MNPYATGILHDNPLRIDALYGCPHVLPKEHTFNFITPRYLRIEKKNLMEPLYFKRPLPFIRRRKKKHQKNGGLSLWGLRPL